MPATRREFLAMTAAVAIASTHGASAQDNYDTLLKNQYAGSIRFLRQLGGGYIDENFKLSSVQTAWRLTLARYRGRYAGHDVDLRGYWIYHPNENWCWQAVNRGGGALRYWNRNGQARGNPEDHELFKFQEVSRAESTVKIYNASYIPYRRAVGSLPSAGRDRKHYVGLVGDQFACNENSDNAAIFTVQFL